MTESDFMREFDRLGVDIDALETVNTGRIPRMRDGRRVRGLYFNRNRAHTVYLTLGPSCDLEPDPTLWLFLSPAEVKMDDKPLRNIVPRSGAIRRSLEQLLRSGL